MTNSKREYNEFIRANLPYGITYDSARYQYVTFNGKRFVTYLEAKWYIDYLTKFGGGPEDDIRNDLFGTSEPGVWFEANDETTLFTDVAGTTPVTTPGDAVALQLDKSGRGNHRTQATTAARPLYALHPVGGVRNLLQYTEEFDNAVWNKTTVTITADDAVAPDGTTSADLFQHSSAGGQIDQDFTVTTGATATISLYIKAKTDGFLRFLAVDGSRSNAFGGWFNTATGEFETANGSGVGVLEGTSVRQIGDYYRVSITGNIPGNTIYSYFFYAVDADGSFTRSTTPKFWVWGAQAEEGSTATNYQRVGSFLDVSEEGKARRGRLWYNGTSHFMQTPTITPGTDKVQVFAGVRKLGETTQTIAELSANLNSNDGAFSIYGRLDTGYGFGSKGTIVEFSSINTGYASPTTNILTGLGDISGDSAILRVDGVQEAISTADQGTGNYLAHPLYFGARAGTTQFFNGYEDTSIIRFGPNLDDTTISKVESYVASKTPEPTL